MNKIVLLVGLAIAVPGIANSQGTEKFQCTYGEMTRRVEILHEAAQSVPCEVHYYKDTENPGSDEVLWSASSDGSYCETKTLEFIAKLESMGWDCGQAASAGPMETDQPDAPDMGDDTADLAPAGPADISVE